MSACVPPRAGGGLRLELRGYRVPSWNLKTVTGWRRQQLAQSAQMHVLAALAQLPERPPLVRGEIAISATARFRHRPLDPDNLRIKPVVDALHYAGVIEDDDYTRVRHVTLRSELVQHGEDALVLQIQPVGVTACSAQLLQEADRLRWEVNRLADLVTRLREQLVATGQTPVEASAADEPPWQSPAGAAPCGCVVWCDRAGARRW
ncbi:MAG: hypothetical protein KatS3mg060_1195 [Dehalococcoidia bacterium]|nr:MAG: hypothetical protein KatS3mg060_1195 [Dehalococcoidia bacterium]